MSHFLTSQENILFLVVIQYGKAKEENILALTKPHSDGHGLLVLERTLDTSDSLGQPAHLINKETTWPLNATGSNWQYCDTKSVLVTQRQWQNQEVTPQSANLPASMCGAGFRKNHGCGISASGVLLVLPH